VAVLSLYDYRLSLEIAAHDPPFYALIMAAYRKADTVNQSKLRAAWPEVIAELEQRYHVPGGYLADRERGASVDGGGFVTRKNLR
jgi:hypothetical protein